MNLNMFNPWKDLTTWSGLTLQYQTSKKGDTYTTYIREKESKKPITWGLSRTSKEESAERAATALKQIGIDGVKRALELGQMVRPPSTIPAAPKEVQWRDGVNHRSRAHDRMVK
jgi:hypothetical protein